MPHRGPYGAPRPPALASLPLPPAPMPARHGLRPLKAWRYVGVFGPELMLCLAAVRVGAARQAFWAVWDRRTRTLAEHTTLRAATVRLAPGRARVRDRNVAIDLRLEETAGIETICRAGHAYAWTRKQAGVRARGTVRLADADHDLDALAVIDDTAAYYPRHTRWHWSAGVGRATDGRGVAWNLVSGVNDPPRGSERTVWIDGAPHEPGPVTFADDLTGVAGLRFSAEATRERHENLLLVRSDYRQPFGTFAGVLPGGIELTEGLGVMELHDAWW